MLKSDVVKSIEQHRRYKKFISARHSRTERHQHHATASNYPKNYNLNEEVAETKNLRLSNLSDYPQELNFSVAAATKNFPSVPPSRSNRNNLILPGMNSTYHSRRLANLESVQRSLRQKELQELTLATSAGFKDGWGRDKRM